MAHEINKTDMVDPDGSSLIQTTIASQFGAGINKKITIQTNIITLGSKYVVYGKYDIKYHGSDLDKAIEAYNEIGA